MVRHFVDLFDLTSDDARELLRRASQLKREFADGVRASYLPGRSLGLIFEKPSLRTRVSFEAAVAQLGGNAIFLRDKDVGMGKRESMADFARVISQYVDALAIRTYAHATVQELAKHATVPIVNALSDSSHPCQAMADMLTIQEAFGSLDGLSLVFVGDGNNVGALVGVGVGVVGGAVRPRRASGLRVSGRFPGGLPPSLSAGSPRRRPRSGQRPARRGCGVHGRLGEHGPGT